MNLVSKEGPIVNTRNGVLVLSVAAGAHNQLKAGAVTISPNDLEMTEEALYQALTMSKEEREHRIATLRHSIEQEDATQWFTRQLEDLQTLL